MKKRVADIIMDVICENNISDCFSVVGGGAMHLNNAFALCDKINKVFNHHEQACAMAAEAYARASGKLAVVCVTSGPGGLNTLTGVEGAWVDSLPMLILSGQVRYETSVEYTGLPLRCRGPQEFDIVQTVSNMTKYAKKIKDPLEIKKELQKAIDLAMNGRRGPVWLDIPLDVQSAIIEESEMYAITPINCKVPIPPQADINEVLEMLKKAKRPCVLTGSGIRTSNAVTEFRNVIKKLRIPIVGGALQGDILYSSYSMYYGMSGTLGPRTGNFILQNADVILVLGNSLSFKQTGYNQENFAPKAKIIYVDIDESEARKPGINIYKFIHSDLQILFNQLNNLDINITAEDEWIHYCNKLRERFSPYESLKDIKDDERVPIHYFWREFEKIEEPDSVVALGNSNCVHARLQSGTKYPEQRILVNYNCGSMGDDLPEAIGAYVALKKEIFCMTGDGSIMMNLQELQTIVHNNFPIKVIAFSNNGYGALRQTNKNYFNGTYIGCDNNSGISLPNFGEIAKAFGFPYKRCNNIGEVSESIQWIKEEKGYAFLEILQMLDNPIEPKVMSRMKEDGTFETPALHDMYPFLDKDEIKKLMYK